MATADLELAMVMANPNLSPEERSARAFELRNKQRAEQIEEMRRAEHSAMAQDLEAGGQKIDEQRAAQEQQRNQEIQDMMAGKPRQPTAPQPQAMPMSQGQAMVQPQQQPQGDYVDPMPQQAPQPMGQQSQGFNDFGLGAAQAKIGQANRAHSGQSQQILDEQARQYDRYNKILEAEKIVNQGEATEVIDLIAKKKTAALESMDKVVEIENRRKDLAAEYMKKKVKLTDEAKYFNMDPVARDKSLAVQRDPNIPDDDPRKIKARETLEMGARLEPGRLLGGARNKVLAIIANVLGGMGAGITGGQNMGYAAVQDAINNDIMSQKERAKSAKEAIGEERNTYAENLKALGDEKLAALATQQMAYDAVANQLESVKFKYGKLRDTSGVDKLIIENNVNRTKTEQAYADAANAKAIDEARLFADIGMKRGQLEAAQSQAVPEREADPPGMYTIPGANPSDDDRKKAKEIGSQAMGAISTAERLYAMTDRGATFSVTERAKAARELEFMIPQLSNLLGSGAPQEAEAERMADTLKNPTKYTLAETKEIWESTIKALKDVTNSRMQVYGFGVGKPPTAGVQKGRAAE